MSATERSRKIDALASWLMILRVPPGIVSAERIAEASAKAAALARELFPPSAKPLEWGTEPNVGEHALTLISQPFLGRWHRIREFTSTPGDLRFNCSFCNYQHTDSIQWCASLDEAKAFCESHHQQRFQELLA